MNRVITLLTERLGVFRTWGSFARVAAWVVVWVLVIGVVLGAAAPGINRDHVADHVPGNRVVYLSPTSMQDYAGFVRPPADDADTTFNVAWIGGSEMKLNAVSVPAAVSHTFAEFGGRPVEHDVYHLVAPRTLDALRMVDSALAAEPDAVVVSISPAWMTDEFELRSWSNLDVANLGSLWRRPDLWPWALALTSPSDVAWRATRAWSSAVEDQYVRNPRLREVVDALDVITRPPGDDGGVAIIENPEGDPRLPPGAAEFWLYEEVGAGAFASVTERQATMLDGFRDEHPVAVELATELLGTLAEADVPVYVYVPPFAPESRSDPHFAEAYANLVAFWQSIAADVDDPQVHVELGDLGGAIPQTNFLDVIHQHDAAPLAATLGPEVCAWWSTQFPGQECA